MDGKAIEFVPSEADLRRFKQSAAASEKERQRRFLREHKELVRRAKEAHAKVAPMMKTLGVSDSELRRWTEQEQEVAKEMSALQFPVDTDVIPWHNQCRTPSGGGISLAFQDRRCVLATTCEFVGTSAAIGRIGARTICNPLVVSTGSALTSVGTTFVAMSSGTLDVSVAGRAFGVGHIGVFFSGYAEAVAGLRVFVERMTPSFQIFEGRLSNWYAHGNLGVEFNRIPVSGLPVGASTQAPADAGSLYRIWADCVQHATQAGVSGAGVAYEVRIDSICIQVL